MDKMRTKPRVSIVLPAYKGDFAREAIGGILEQTYRDFELIVVDDASPFDFHTLISQFGDERIRYHRNRENLGGVCLAEAYRNACSFATGKYLVIASDDDVYYPTYLERMVELAEAHPECSLFSCRVGHVDERGQLLNPGVPVLPHESPLYYIWMHEAKRRHLTLFEWFMRKSAFDAIGGIAQYPLGWFSDTQTMYQLATYKNGGVWYDSAMLGAYRDSTIQVSSPERGIGQKCEATIKFYEWLETFLKNQCASLIVSKEDAVLMAGITSAQAKLARSLLLQLVRRAGSFCDAVSVARCVLGTPYVSGKSVLKVFFQRVFPSLA